MIERKEKYTAAFYTLGCRVNQYETRAVEEAFVSGGFEIGDFDAKCDVYVINTCTVTAESDRKSRQIIRRAVKNGGGEAVVIVIGCMSQTNPEQAKKIHGVDAVFGTGEKMACAALAKKLVESKKSGKEHETEDFVDDIFSHGTIEHMSVHGSDNTRAFLKVVDGCDNKCSYCIIPKARGHVRSKSIDEVVGECCDITASGCREIVLTGIETAAFGKDCGLTLSDLAEKVSEIENVKRIRFGSLEPTVITQKLVSELSDIPEVMPHFHLSLQSGCDDVLKAMRRKYNTGMFLEKLNMLHEYFPDFEATTDIIVGFPGETEDMFLETLEFVEKCGFLYVHVFPYSDRKGTAASEFDGKLPENVKHERAAMLTKKMLEVRKKTLEKYAGKTANVLWETYKNGYAHGYTENYIEVRYKDAHFFKPNDITKIRLEKIDENAGFVFAGQP